MERSDEAFEVLLGDARGKTGAIPADRLVTPVLAVTSGTEFPVRRAALEALLRRLSSARDGQLRVLRRPAGRAKLGLYRVGRVESKKTGYSAVVRSLDPLSGSCDCPDFLRSSLGLCKHLLHVLEGLFKKNRQLKAIPPTVTTAGLEWDPVRPLEGLGDWLERVRYRRALPGAVSELATRTVSRWFTREGRIESAFFGEPSRRLQLVRDLLRFVTAAGRSPNPTCDPALLPMLKAEEAKLERLEKNRLTPREARGLLKGFKQKLYPYQQEGVDRFLTTHRLLLADDMGLGKTAQAIACCHALFNSGRITRGLVVTPAALKPQWLREWKAFTDAPLYLLEGRREERAQVMRRTEHGFLLVNYEQVLRDLPRLIEFRPQMGVLDEAQRIKNWASKTALYVKRLEPEYRLVLTGTPMENRIDELASLMDWVDDRALEPKWRLGPAHAVYADGKREVVGVRNLETLRTRVRHCMVRRVRREVLAQLPERTDTRIPTLLTPEQQSEHDSLSQPIASLLRRSQTRPLTQGEFTKLMTLLNTQRVICNGLGQMQFEEVWPSLVGKKPTESLLRGLFSPKLTELRELVSQIAVGQKRKMVIFSQWKRMLKLSEWAVADLLAEAGLRAAFFTGDEGQRRRTQNLVDFHDDPSVAILFATDAGGVGLNLQKAASCCVNLEVPWNPAVLEQRVGRVHRMGQPRPVEVYNFVSESGIEPRIAAIVSGKKALFTGLFDGKSDEVMFERSGSFISRVEQVVEAPAEAQVREDDIEIDVVVDGAAMAAAPELADALPTALEAAPDRIPPLELPGLASLVQSIQVRPTADGRVVIEAPAEVASTLAAFFQGVAGMLARSVPPTQSPAASVQTLVVPQPN